MNRKGKKENATWYRDPRTIAPYSPETNGWACLTLDKRKGKTEIDLARGEEACRVETLHTICAYMTADLPEPERRLYQLGVSTADMPGRARHRFSRIASNLVSNRLGGAYRIDGRNWFIFCAALKMLDPKREYTAWRSLVTEAELDVLVPAPMRKVFCDGLRHVTAPYALPPTVEGRPVDFDWVNGGVDTTDEHEKETAGPETTPEPAASNDPMVRTVSNE